MFCVFPRKPAPFYFGRAASVGKVSCCVYESESCSSCSSSLWHWNKSAWWSYQHLKSVMDQPPLISSLIHGPVTGGRLKSLLKRNNQRNGEDVQMQITLWVVWRHCIGFFPTICDNVDSAVTCQAYRSSWILLMTFGLKFLKESPILMVGTFISTFLLCQPYVSRKFHF